MNDFQKEIYNLPFKKRSYQASSGKWNMPLKTCLFGVPNNKFFGWKTLEEVPSDTLGFDFYLGGTAPELFAAFSRSEFPSQIERLTIGDSTFSNDLNLDYREIVDLLSVVEFPKLKELHLGISVAFCNAHGAYGKLGDVTKILTHAPNIEKLSLGGKFDLAHELVFSQLKNLTVELDDYTTCINGGLISNEVLSYLLDSSFPKLEEAFIDLICDAEPFGYEFPSKFLTGELLPELKKIEITGEFKSGEKKKFFGNKFYERKDIVFHLDDIKEI